MPPRAKQLNNFAQFRVGNQYYAVADIGILVRETRQARDETLKVVAEQFGINSGTLSRLEQGKTAPGSVTLAQMLHYVFGDAQVHFDNQSEPPSDRTLIASIIENSGISDMDRKYVLKLWETIHELLRSGLDDHDRAYILAVLEGFGRYKSSRLQDELNTVEQNLGGGAGREA
jgi:transcriptional regulator with XRE-family HTH domain